MIVLFDIGSTLIDGPSYGPSRRLAQMLGLRADAIPHLDRLLFRMPSQHPSDLAAAIRDQLCVDAEDACTQLWEAQLKEAYVLPGAREAIASLNGIPRAYLSNIWPPFYEHFRHEFPSEADAPQFLSFQVGLMKPDRAFFEHALRELKTEPEQVVMVGDTYTNDILPAIELGMRTVWVLHRPDKERESLVKVLNGSAPAPDVTLGSIADLQPCILSNMKSSPKPIS